LTFGALSVPKTNLIEPLGFSGTSDDSIAFEISIMCVIFLASTVAVNMHKVAITDVINPFMNASTFFMQLL
jgi:hypothetical protein